MIIKISKYIILSLRRRSILWGEIKHSRLRRTRKGEVRGWRRVQVL